MQMASKHVRQNIINVFSYLYSKNLKSLYHKNYVWFFQI